MAFPHISWLRKIELDIEVPTSPATLLVKTDVPGGAMAVRETLTVPICTRRTVTLRMSYSVQAHLVQLSLTPGANSQVRLYGIRIWARVLPNGAWNWFSYPVIPTPEADWRTIQVAIPPTPEEWSTIAVQIPPTPEAWSDIPVSVPGTPEDWSIVTVPVPPTSDDWNTIPLPIKPTPPVPDWVEMQTDQ